MQDALVEREQRIVHESMHDRLTGLPNRNALDAALRKALREIISKLESSAALIASSLESLDRWADEVREGQSRDRHDDDFPE